MIKMVSKGTFSKTFKYLEGMKDRILKTPSINMVKWG